MSNVTVDLGQPNPLKSPACDACGAPMRLTGIEPHPTLARTDLHTYQCLACDAVQAVQVPIVA